MQQISEKLRGWRVSIFIGSASPIKLDKWANLIEDDRSGFNINKIITRFWPGFEPTTFLLIKKSLISELHCG